jgi:glycosyltransferase involved in cell wall biosynthesis
MIPTCDDADLLPRALRSVLEQDPGPEQMQVQVVDDASGDADVVALVRELAGDRVEVHRHPNRVGAPANFTACAQRSRGRWVHILHADDLVLPGFYDAYAAHLDAHPAAMAVSRSWFIDADEQRHGLSGPLDARDGYLVDAERALALDNPVNFVAVVVARDAFERLGAVDPHRARRSGGGGAGGARGVPDPRRLGHEPAPALDGVPDGPGGGGEDDHRPHRGPGAAP